MPQCINAALGNKPSINLEAMQAREQRRSTIERTNLVDLNTSGVVISVPALRSPPCPPTKSPPANAKPLGCWCCEDSGGASPSRRAMFGGSRARDSALHLTSAATQEYNVGMNPKESRKGTVTVPHRKGTEGRRAMRETAKKIEHPKRVHEKGWGWDTQKEGKRKNGPKKGTERSVRAAGRSMFGRSRVRERVGAPPDTRRAKTRRKNPDKRRVGYSSSPPSTCPQQQFVR